MSLATRAVLALLALPALASAWGWQGHKLITELAIDRLPAEIRAIYAPVMAQLLESTVEPDKRVFKDPREGPKHFLNLEVLDPSYHAAWAQADPGLLTKPKRAKHGHKHQWGDDAPEAASSASAADEVPHTPALQEATFGGKLPLSAADADKLYASLPPDEAAYFKAYEAAYQKEVGQVVYQPAHYYAELVKAFRAGDPARIAGVTGFLSHYTGDLHVPLHNTIDHEGGFSHTRFIGKGANATVHSRFETGLLKFLTPALPALAAKHLKAPATQDPAGITARAMRESREAWALYPSVIEADRATMAKYPGKTVQWQRFYGDLEPRMAPVVGEQLAKSAQMLADLIVTAWQESKKK